MYEEGLVQTKREIETDGVRREGRQEGEIDGRRKGRKEG